MTMKDVDAAWDRYTRMKERAEQHDFPDILWHDLRFGPLYEDLRKNFTEEHAVRFVDALNSYVDHMGYGV